MSTKTKTDVPALARALCKVLANDHTDYTTGCNRPAGNWFGTVADLWTDLRLEASGWIHNTCERPHETTELRRALKAHALELHRDFGVIVTLDGKLVDLKLVRRKG